MALARQLNPNIMQHGPVEDSAEGFEVIIASSFALQLLWTVALSLLSFSLHTRQTPLSIAISDIAVGNKQGQVVLI